MLQELVSGGKAYNASTDDMDALFAQARYRYQLQLEKQKDNDKLGVGILRALFQPDGAHAWQLGVETQLNRLFVI